MGQRSKIEKGITHGWMLGAFRGVRAWEKQSVERNAGFAGDVAEVFDDGRDEWDPFFAAQFIGFAFGIARNQWASGAGGWLGGAEDADVVVDLALEGIGVHEAIDAHGAEEMADALADAAFRDFQTEGKGRSERAPIGAAEDGTQNVHHHSQGVPVVAPAFAMGAQLEEGATGHEAVRVRGGAPLAVNAPAGCHGFPLASRPFDLLEGAGARRPVYQYPRIFPAGEGNAD